MQQQQTEQAVVLLVGRVGDGFLQTEQAVVLLVGRVGDGFLQTEQAVVLLVGRVGDGFLHFPGTVYWMQGLQARNTVFLAYMLSKCGRPLALKHPLPLCLLSLHLA